MSFNDNAQIDTSNVESGGSGGRGGGIAVGGGIGGLIIALLVFLFTGQLPDTGTTTTTTDSSQEQEADPDWLANCKTGADANKDDRCLVAATAASAEAYWEEAFTGEGGFQPATTVVYQGTTQSACGTASNQVGPFYCPTDQKIYVDADFFQILSTQFGSDDGQLAKEYVVAHEYGHHIQNLYGILGNAQQDPQGAESGAVRIELMADCFGGMWAQHASSTDSGNGEPFLKKLTESDIKSALSAASAVGDDNIQEKTQGRTTPESWTHGSAEARMKWFVTGMKAKKVNDCDTFAVDSVYQ